MKNQFDFSRTVKMVCVLKSHAKSEGFPSVKKKKDILITRRSTTAFSANLHEDLLQTLHCRKIGSSEVV